MTARTILAGLVGRGIRASASPAIYMREAAAQGLSLRYDLVDFDALAYEDSCLGAQLDKLAARGYAGINITYPFKQAVIELLDEVDETARALGAVNCVAFREGRKIGLNSDWQGFAYLIEMELGGRALGTVTQVGAGGAGSATAYALLAAGTQELRICDTDGERAGALVERLSAQFPAATVRTLAELETALEGADGIVQATPVGMASHPGTPFDPDLLRPEQWLADIIYFPRETELVREALARGLHAVGGSDMVIGQASLPFEYFTGHAADRERMLAAFLAADNAARQEAE
jgi:shikimate dehydrogenase